ncbi:MAG: T9SS type A sorting domain-containing protein [Ignavibacteriae bacterium]|nr:T9SS type A sorting domain-containing protein [Ignavibacteriota bacterium]
MKRILFIFALLGFIGAASEASAYERKALSTIKNFAVSSGTYSFEIWAKNDSTTTTFFVGNCSFYFTYNVAALNNPTLTNVNPKYTGQAGVDNYNPMTVDINPGTGRVYVTISFTGAGGGSSQLSTTSPDGERICTVNLNILNQNATASLSWDQINSAVLTTGTFSVFQTFFGSDNRTLPVQLASFTGRVVNQQGHIRLDWRTLTETNNFGFYVQKSLNSQSGFQTISDVIPGQGTTLVPHDYTWTDVNVTAGSWYYRLKQVDMDLTEHFSEPILPNGVTGVNEKPLPTEFALNQNYPNPFNPKTKIEYAVPTQSLVKIEVYNLLGQRVAMLVNEVKPAGYYVVDFNANGVSSGLYFYRMTTAGAQTFLKKMILMK